MQDPFEKFRSVTIPDFPRDNNVVYIITYTKDGKEIPIYVGETTNLRRRIGDYIVASFQAPTDFKVGEAIKYFQENGYEVKIKYTSSSNDKERREEEEKKTLNYFIELGYLLLNLLEGYNYKNANKEKERIKVREFCDAILENIPKTNS